VQIASKSECVTYIILSAVGLIGNNKTATQPLHRERNPLLHKNTKTTTAALQEFRHNNKHNTVDYDTHTCTDPSKGPMSGNTRVSRYQKGNTNVDFTETRDSEWQWHQLGHMQVCTLLQTDNHASTLPLCFLQAGCLSCHPTNSIKALKAKTLKAVD